MPSWREEEDEIYVFSLFPTPPPVKYLAEGTNQRAARKRGVNTSTGAPGRQQSEGGGGCHMPPAPRAATGRDPLKLCSGGVEKAQSCSASCCLHRLIYPGHAIAKITQKDPRHRCQTHQPESMAVLGQAGQSRGKPGPGRWGGCVRARRAGRHGALCPPRTRLVRSGRNARTAPALRISFI